MNRLYHPFGFRVYLICRDLKKFGEADNTGRQSACEVTLFLCDLPALDLCGAGIQTALFLVTSFHTDAVREETIYDHPDR